jgi:hypothetical protein
MHACLTTSDTLARYRPTPQCKQLAIYPQTADTLGDKSLGSSTHARLTISDTLAGCRPIPRSTPTHTVTHSPQPPRNVRVPAHLYSGTGPVKGADR